MPEEEKRLIPAIVPRAGSFVLPTLEGRDLVSVQDFAPEEITQVLNLALAMKARPADFRGILTGKQVVLFFEKPSLRTRLTFEAGMNSLGGVTFFVDQTASRLGAREPLRDIAKNLERWVDGVVLRTCAHATITEMAEHASIPVVNALSDLEHPCQALADFMTLLERFGDLRSVKLGYVGDGNNVAHSLLLAAAAVGAHIHVATPTGYAPDADIVATARALAAETGAHIVIDEDAFAAVQNADAVYTDVWASMGQENEAAQRKQIFQPYQVNQRLFARAAKTAVFMHCLPAHRGDEVTAAVIDSARSVVYDQAENRLHVQKAIMAFLLGNGIQRFPSRSAHA